MSVFRPVRTRNQADFLPSLNRRGAKTYSLKPVAKNRKQRLLHDRDKLLAALHDYQRGKGTHLAESELTFLIERIKQRLADLEAKLHEEHVE
jgi:hypothetical protein